MPNFDRKLLICILAFVNLLFTAFILAGFFERINEGSIMDVLIGTFISIAILPFWGLFRGTVSFPVSLTIVIILAMVFVREQSVFEYRESLDAVKNHQIAMADAKYSTDWNLLYDVIPGLIVWFCYEGYRFLKSRQEFRSA